MPEETIFSPDVATAFRGAMRRLASTVTIVTATDGNRRHGMTATAVTSLSMEPPSLLVCLNQRTLLHGIMQDAEMFCVNILRHEHASLSSAFAGAVDPAERFNHGGWRYGEDGLPFLADAQAVLVCRRTAAMAAGTHTIFVGEVVRAAHCEDVAALIYENAQYCRTAPVTSLAA